MAADTSDRETLRPGERDHANILSPVIGLRPRDLAASGATLLKQAVLQPALGAEYSAKFIADIARIAIGKSDVGPDPRDRRFADDAYRSSGLFLRLAQGWCAFDRNFHSWIEATNLEGDALKRAQFFATQVSDALAPPNFLLGNPSALRTARETRGKSLLHGLRNFAKDVLDNGGMPNQVDKRRFHVGMNLATSPGAVILEHPIAELIQYAPATKRVRSRPVLIAPPQINKFYIYDLSPHQSLVKYLVEQGFQVFIISWKNPTTENRDWGIAEYADLIGEALTTICKVSGQDKVDIVGACAGGITVAAALAYFAAIGRNDDVSSLTLMVNVLEPKQDDTEAGLFINDAVIEAARKRSSRAGVLDGKSTARVFNWMRPNDLIWNYVANNYLHGRQPPAFDLLYWNADTTRLPARLHSDFLDVFKDNPFRNPGSMLIRDVPIDINDVKCPVFITGGTTDHITPWRACYRSTQLFPGDTTFVLSTAGHIQSIINPPGNAKRRYLTNDQTPADPDEWLANAKENDDSWWPYWCSWLRSQSDEERNAPRKQGNAEFPPLRPAPGFYVHED